MYGKKAFKFNNKVYECQAGKPGKIVPRTDFSCSYDWVEPTDAQIVRVKQYLSELFPVKAEKEVVELALLSLLTENDGGNVFVFIGDDNGKTTLVNFIASMLSDYFAHVTFDQCNELILSKKLLAISEVDNANTKFGSLIDTLYHSIHFYGSFLFVSKNENILEYFPPCIKPHIILIPFRNTFSSGTIKYNKEFMLEHRYALFKILIDKHRKYPYHKVNEVLHEKYKDLVKDQK
jgi:hypothetical protein